LVYFSKYLLSEILLIIIDHLYNNSQLIFLIYILKYFYSINIILYLYSLVYNNNIFLTLFINKIIKSGTTRNQTK